MDTAELLKKYELKQAGVIAAEPQVSAARFSPCGRLLAAGGYDARVRRWSFEDGDTAGQSAARELPPLAGHHAWVEGIAFRAEGELLFTADSWGLLCCWAGYAGQQPALKWKHEQAHDGWIRSLAVSPDGKLLASCAADRFVRLWNADDGAKQREIKLENGPLSLWFAPDGTLLVGDDRGIIQQLQLDGTLVRKFDASSLYTLSRLQDVGGVVTLATDKEGKVLAAGGTTPKNGGTVVGPPTLLLFDLATGEHKHKVTLGSDNDCYVADVHFHDEGFVSLVTYGTPGQGQLLYLKLGEEKPFFTKKLVNPHSLSWRADGKLLAIAATNAGSNGNGRPLDKDGKYKGNSSPIHLFALKS
jgi:WD40 repeat protein